MSALTHRALILSLIASLLWPWAVTAATCAQHATSASDCCTTRCCCEQEADDADPCGCCAKEAPAVPVERAPAAPATSNAPDLDRALDLAPTIDLGTSLRAGSAPSVSPLARHALRDGGRRVLLQACRLRH